jgi:hypothetical protein
MSNIAKNSNDVETQNDGSVKININLKSDKKESD